VKTSGNKYARMLHSYIGYSYDKTSSYSKFFLCAVVPCVFFDNVPLSYVWLSKDRYIICII